MARHSLQLRSNLFEVLLLDPKNFLVEGFLLTRGVMGEKVLGVGSGLIMGEGFPLEPFFVDLSSSWDMVL